MANVIDSFNYDESTYVFTLPYGSCSTNPTQKNKEVEVPNFSLETGARVAVKFTTTNTASSPTLNVSGTGAKQICYNGSEIAAEFLAEGKVYEFVYDGTQWDLLGDPTPEDTNEDFSKVGWSQIIKDGIKIASITIDGNSTDVYAPTSDGNTGDGNTQYSTHVGEADTLANDVVASGPYLKLVADSASITSKHQIKGEGATKVSSDANGNINIYTPLETELSKEVTGTGNAVTDISVSDHKITLTKGATFLTGHPGIPTSSDSTSAVSPAHGGTFTAVDSVDRDNNGHVTKVNTKTVTLPTVTFEHPDIEMSTNTTSTAAPAHGGTFTAIDSITKDSDGHVTKFNTKTVTLPAAEHPSITTTTDTTSTDSPSYNGDFTAVDSVTRDNNGHVKKINTKAVSLKKAFDDFEDKISENLESETNELVIADDNAYKIFQVSVDGLATTDITAQNITAQNINGFDWAQHCTSGVKIATVTMNNTTTDVYAPLGEDGSSVGDGNTTYKTTVGTSSTLTNGTTTNGNTYLKLIADNSSITSKHLIKGTGRTSVTSTASGNINIFSPVYDSAGDGIVDQAKLIRNEYDMANNSAGADKIYMSSYDRLNLSTSNSLFDSYFVDAENSTDFVYVSTDGIGTYRINKRDGGKITDYSQSYMSAGKLYSNNAEISGKITATEGEIAGFTIEDTSITTNITKSSINCTTVSGVYIGTDGIAIGHKLVATDDGGYYYPGVILNADTGKLTANNTEITGGTISIGDTSTYYYTQISDTGVLTTSGSNINHSTITNNSVTISDSGGITESNTTLHYSSSWGVAPPSYVVGYGSLTVSDNLLAGSDTSPIVMFAGNNWSNVLNTSDAATNTDELNFYVTQSGLINAKSLFCHGPIGLENDFGNVSITPSMFIINNTMSNMILSLDSYGPEWTYNDSAVGSINATIYDYMILGGEWRVNTGEGNKLCVPVRGGASIGGRLTEEAYVALSGNYAYLDVAETLKYLIETVFPD